MRGPGGKEASGGSFGGRAAEAGRSQARSQTASAATLSVESLLLRQNKKRVLSEYPLLCCDENARGSGPVRGNVILERPVYYFSIFNDLVHQIDRIGILFFVFSRSSTPKMQDRYTIFQNSKKKYTEDVVSVYFFGFFAVLVYRDIRTNVSDITRQQESVRNPSSWRSVLHRIYRRETLPRRSLLR